MPSTGNSNAMVVAEAPAKLVKPGDAPELDVSREISTCEVLQWADNYDCMLMGIGSFFAVVSFAN